MKRRQFLHYLAGSAVFAAVPSCLYADSVEAGQRTQRPNVLLILADDLGWSDLGCYGGEINTPNIDALAADGLRFTQFYNSARCCPSRAALLTGLNPRQAGFADMVGALSENAVTLPEVLKDAGYSTYMTGKWHLSEQSSPTKRGFDEFYGMLGGFGTYWKENPLYTRLPEGRSRREYKSGAFYSTNAFGDYAIDFIDQGIKSGKPWFQYLAFNAPHFPLHAPEDVIAHYESVYQRGWDVVRAARLERQKKFGLVPTSLPLTPRSVVPANAINKRTGWADKENPAWDSLSADRRGDLARRMAVYAAAVEVMDRNIGRVVAHLKETKQWDNTLVFFLSDNGACAEWDPYGFDQLDSTKNIVHTGDALKTVGGPNSYISYGSGWANASNTPWRLYKHYAQEGGIRTPLIVHWPAGLKTTPGALTTQPGFITDFMPTLLEVCGARYPDERNGNAIVPEQGISLAALLRGGNALPPRILCMEHEGNRMVRESDWKLVALRDHPWELYNLASDPSEMRDLSAKEPDRVRRLGKDWEAWAEISLVTPRPSPQIAGKPLTLRCDVTPQSRDGVILAQGGSQRGYALHLKDGKPVFSVRENTRLYTITAPDVPKGPRYFLEARLAKGGAMTLAVNGKVVARGTAPGLIQLQPQDALTIGEDTFSAVGDYSPPHRLKGTVTNVKILTDVP